jgi:hypothetical protein
MFSKYFLDILADFKPEESPMRPEAAALFRKRSNLESPSTRCVPQGIPRGDLDNYLPFKIIQTPRVIAALSEPRLVHDGTLGEPPPLALRRKSARKA